MHCIRVTGGNAFESLLTEDGTRKVKVNMKTVDASYLGPYDRYILLVNKNDIFI